LKWKEIAMTIPPEAAGLIHLPSSRSVADTVARVVGAATAKGLTVFSLIDFAKDAAANGLSMLPAQLLLLGNPKSGTPLMVATPTVAIDLPLKALAWEDAEGHVWLSINSPEYLQERHGFPAELVGNIAGLQKLLEAAVK
jgi:uncharacterized protein (DUF302 family)